MDELRMNQRIAFSELRTVSSPLEQVALLSGWRTPKSDEDRRDYSRRCSTFLLALDAKTFSCQRTRGERLGSAAAASYQPRPAMPLGRILLMAREVRQTIPTGAWLGLLPQLSTEVPWS